MSTLVCTYVLEDTEASKQDIYRAIARLSVLWFYQHEHESTTNSWLSSGFRKHFRRAKASQFDALLVKYPTATVATAGVARLLALPLLAVDEIPKEIKRLQMSNFKINDASDYTDNSIVKITLNQKANMSFGKAAIAVAHAAQELARKLQFALPEAYEKWRAVDYEAIVVEGQLEDFMKNSINIEDLGLAEVEAGTITAQAALLDGRERND